jgi:hypothetical protein
MAHPPRSTKFRALFESALLGYKKKTGITLADHPLAVQLQSCHSVESITAFLQGQAQAVSNLRESDRIMKSIKTSVSILSPLSTADSLADAFDLVRQKAVMACFTSLTGFLQTFPPAKAIQSGLAILLVVCALLWFIWTHPCNIQVNQAANGVISSCDALVDLLESTEHLLSRLDVYMRVPPTPAMDEIVLKIMVELLSTLALATRELKQGRSSGSFLADVLPYSVQRSQIHEESFRRE